MVSKFDPDKKFINRSIIQMHIENHGNLQHHYVDFQRIGLYRAPGCISIDRTHSNTLARCFDDDKTYEKLKNNEAAHNLNKTAFEHIKTVFDHYNNKYNPFKVFSGDGSDVDNMEYYIIGDNPELKEDKKNKVDGQKEIKTDDHEDDHHHKPKQIEIVADKVTKKDLLENIEKECCGKLDGCKKKGKFDKKGDDIYML